MSGYFIYCRKSSEAEDRQVLSIESQISALKELAVKLNLSVMEVLTESKFGMAQKYVDDLSKNVKRGLKTKLENGWFPATPPSGYQNYADKMTGRNTIIKDPELFPHVRRMWDLMLAGTHTPTRILDLANQQWGLRTRRTRQHGGKPFSRSAIYKIFSSPFYYGWFEFPRGSGHWFRGKHETMVTEGEYERVQVLLGRRGNPRPRSKREFAFTGLIQCGDCGRAVTAEEKHQLICDSCKLKFAYRKQDRCPGCQVAVDSMVKPVFLHYTYYHCSKSRKPLCPQRSVNGEELERQIMEFLGRITLSFQFKDWAIRYLHELHEQEIIFKKDILKSQNKAHEECLAQLENLLTLKTSPANRDGSLLSDEEYARRRGKLLKEKATLESGLSGAAADLEKPLSLSEQLFEFACKVQEKFTKGGPEVKKQILDAVSSNLTLKNKILLIEARKPFGILGDTMPFEISPILPIEPEKTLGPAGQKTPSTLLRPSRRAMRELNPRPFFWREM